MGFLEALRRAPSWVRWLLALLPLRIALVPLIPLLPEEAYHWNFARHLDWGYLDHPPVIAWAIAAGRLVFGDNAVGVRAVPLLFSIGTTIVLARLAVRFYGEAAGVWAVILFTFEPVALPVSESGFPDSPMLFFWALAMALVWDAVERQSPKRWLLAGAALGAAMLSKYTAVMLVPGVFLHLATSKRDRRWLATPWPYLAGLVALVVFTPVLYWNYKHDWASLLFQSKGRFEEARGFDPRTFRRFLWVQAIASFPLTLPLAGAAIVRMVRTARPEEAFFRWCLLPIVGLFAAVSWIRPIHVLWPLPGYLGLLVVMAGVATEGVGKVARFYAKARTALVAVSLILLLGCGVHLAVFLPWLSPFEGPYGWKEVARRAQELRRDLPPSAFYLAIGRKYATTSQLAYQLNLPYEVHGAHLIEDRALQYAFWCDPQTLGGRDALVVIEGDERTLLNLRVVKRYFASVEPAGEVLVPVGRSTLQEVPPLRFALFFARGYRPPAMK